MLGFIEQTKQFNGDLATMKELQFLRAVTERYIIVRGNRRRESGNRKTRTALRLRRREKQRNER